MWSASGIPGRSGRQVLPAWRRCALGHVIDRSMALVEFLREKGPKTVHNMDTLLLRESMDVIGEPAAPCLLTFSHLQAQHAARSIT